ncbi:MAG: lytic transglycosylase domain-containing protein [Acidisphaera sp.]|nr:lytic transglycosylase domain-containing protein [Acidisphaera sp.]
MPSLAHDPRRRALCALGLLACAALAGCAGHSGSRSGGGYARAGNYAEPGPAEDPWGPYVHEAAARFSVPETWVREVMRQESGGQEFLGGQPTTSSAGAMGLMQVMPDTYAMLRDRYGLGSDPYDPHDNILAGTAYIREMYDRYGSPGFLAAYNAGPQRLDDYLSGAGTLPNETVNYLASVAPRLGEGVPSSGPLAVYAGGPAAPPEVAVAAVAPSPAVSSPVVFSRTIASNPIMSSLIAPAEAATLPPAAPDVAGAPVRAELADDGSIDAAAIPPPAAGSIAPPVVPVAAPPVPRFRLVALSAPVVTTPQDMSRWGVQVGAFADPGQARAAAEGARSLAGGALGSAQVQIGATTRPDGMVLYRARLVGLSADAAAEGCNRLSQARTACLTVPPDSAS